MLFDKAIAESTKSGSPFLRAAASAIMRFSGWCYCWEVTSPTLVATVPAWGYGHGYGANRSILEAARGRWVAKGRDLGGVEAYREFRLSVSHGFLIQGVAGDVGIGAADGCFGGFGGVGAASE